MNYVFVFGMIFHSEGGRFDLLSPQICCWILNRLSVCALGKKKWLNLVVVA